MTLGPAMLRFNHICSSCIDPTRLFLPSIHRIKIMLLLATVYISYSTRQPDPELILNCVKWKLQTLKILE